ncbi:MAG: hypothetical protein KGJ36_08615, partial [Acidobacteriota bacterium]|nr:hypothetical protein [Acidobacteriota bacterium]
LLAVCVALRPARVLSRDEGGVSNYGVHVVTVVPYTLAYAIGAWLLVRAARAMAGPGSASLRRLALLLGALMAATLVTTYAYTRDTAWRDGHFAVGAAFVLAEAASAPWLARRASRPAGAVLVTLVLAGVALCALATVGVWRVLFAGQVLLTAGYAPLLVIATARLSVGLRGPR